MEDWLDMLLDVSGHSRTGEEYRMDFRDDQLASCVQLSK